MYVTFDWSREERNKNKDNKNKDRNSILSLFKAF